jgi:penicillin-binding protein 1C
VNKHVSKVVSSTRVRIICLVLAVLSVVYFFSLPDVLFHDPYSTVLEDHEGKLLTASIAPDGQWRFPERTTVPEKFATALINFEDKRFYYHPGVDPFSMARAIRQNIQAGRIVSGGSTLSMQVIRLSRKGEARTVLEKFIEMILATRLELRYSKEEILALYAAHAPFGGNVVGLEAACWRYFGRGPESLSWAEAATLAVLPNAPALIHPGKNRNRLLAKRNALLDKLHTIGVLDEFSLELAKAEPMPDKPQALPQQARHLLVRAKKDGYEQRTLRTTLHADLQQRTEQAVQDHLERLAANQIYNTSAIILDVETGRVLSYVGNGPATLSQHGREVDVIGSPRSTGSILKPFLYASMLDDGKILPASLLEDVPTYINGFAPRNFSHQFDGVVPANEALIRSLNVPAVQMLRDYRYERFYEQLRNIGLSTLNKPADHYGLALILGGAEGTLWDITGMYASMSRTLNHYFQHPGANRYRRSDFHSPVYMADATPDSLDAAPLAETSWYSASSIYLTWDALKEVYRPGEESGWRYFSNARNIAWKTGTSFGFRDGWAVGTTPRHVVGVWVGNADGEGRPGLTGTDAAAPLMFEIFSYLQDASWFPEPSQDMVTIEVCTRSGNRAAATCEKTEQRKVGKAGLDVEACSFHRAIHVTPDHRHRVHSNCEPVSRIKTVNWFVLSPVQEFYYKPRNVSYQSLPPYRKDCIQLSSLQSMELIYPKPGARIFIPRTLDGAVGSAVFHLAHRDPEAIVYWHLDQEFAGITQKTHQMAVQLPPGKHVLTLVDKSGEVLVRPFEVISGM